MKYPILNTIIILIIFVGCKEQVSDEGSCGDGIIDVGEQCDGILSGEASCQDHGYHGGVLVCANDCTLDFSGCAPFGSCGDGVLQSDYEACEGSNLNSKSCTTASEGEFVAGTLACDDQCQFDFTACTRNICGNNAIEAGEECEGFNLDGETCNSLGYHGGALACTEQCQFDLTGCEAFGRCGDGTVDEPAEECDGQNLGGESCLSLGFYSGTLYCASDCTLNPVDCTDYCGDGLIQSGTPGEEECDTDDLGGESCESLGYYGGSLSCSETCTHDISSCEAAGRCGDHTVQASHEECEGTDLAGASCLSLGYYGGTLACGGDCSFDTGDCEAYGWCGDGTVQSAHEVCDTTPPTGITCAALGYNGGTVSCGADCQPSTSTCTDPVLTSITVGASHSCGLDIFGNAWCWGQNSYGQLGDGTRTQRSTAAKVTGDLTFTSVVTAGHYTCALTTSGAAYCWGKGGYHMGNGSLTDKLIPTAVSGGHLFASISTSPGHTYYTHTCGLTAAGEAWCWGLNDAGQLGTGTTTYSSLPVQVAGGHTFSAIACGDAFTCGVTASGALCWGYNYYGQLGTGTTTESLLPMDVTGGSDFRAITAGSHHACAIDGTGAAWCWGRNRYGRLGDGTETDSLIPLPVAGGHIFSSISCNAHTCAITTDDELYCWGAGTSGELGNNTYLNSAVPSKAFGADTYAEIAVGWIHTCAVTSGGETRCFGLNEFGQLGIGGEMILPSPALLPSGNTYEQVSLGAMHGCGLTVTGEIWCWGSNNYGMLGDGSGNDSVTPVQVAGGHSYTQVTTGYEHNCALRDDGRVLCWGRNDTGVLGTGDYNYMVIPTLISLDATFTRISSGSYHACGVTDSGEAWCWGRNDQGRLGSNAGSMSALPVQVTGAGNYTFISAGLDYTCAIDANSDAWCWGRNESGELGDGTTSDSTAPVSVTGGYSFQFIDAGNATCGITTAGVTLCWGDGEFGLLGTNTTLSHTSPTPVFGGHSFDAVSVGAFRDTCALTASGELYSWGWGIEGILALQDSPDLVLAPARAAEGLLFSMVKVGPYGACGVTTTGEIHCWGNNDLGRLGQPVENHTKSIPTPIASF